MWFMHYFPSMGNDGWMSSEDQESLDDSNDDAEKKTVKFYCWRKTKWTQETCITLMKIKHGGTWSKVVKDLKVHIYWKRKQVNLFILWLKIFPNFFRNSSNSYGIYTLWGQFLLLLFTSWLTRTGFFVLKFNPAEAKTS